MRDDGDGLFWLDEEAPRHRNSGGGGPRKAAVDKGPRPLPPIPDTGWQLPTTFPDLSGQGMIALDVETFDPELRIRGPGYLWGAYICGVAIGTEAGFRGYYPVRQEIGPNFEKDQVFSWLRHELKKPIPKVGANLIYDIGHLNQEGVEVAGPYYDVQIAEPLLDENKLMYSLESIARDYGESGKVERVMRDWLERAFGDEDNIKENIWRAPSAVVGPYAEGDVDLPLKIFAKQKLELERLGLWDVFILESKLLPLLLAMRRRGVRVDLDKTELLIGKLVEREEEAVAKIKNITGVEANVWAADSLAKVYDKAGIKYPYTAKTGKPSFTKPWLIAQNDPISMLVAETRRLEKFRGTFLEGYIYDGHHNGRIHTQFHQLRSDEGGTVSGRFSSSTPNLQNIPIRDKELGPLIRSIFLPEEMQRWWKFDWSQIEYRLAIHHAFRLRLTGAEKIVNQYLTDPTTDYHQVVAEITSLSRAAAKNINFGILYGMGIDKLCRDLGVPFNEAKRMYNKYIAKVPFVKKLLGRASDAAHDLGEIRTMSGRIRHFNMWERDGAYYPHEVPGAQRAFTHKALNSRLQGDAADIMKISMVRAWEDGVFDYIGAPHLTVHDELDGSEDETPKALEALRELKYIMENCVKLAVPLIAEGGTGENWSAIK